MKLIRTERGWAGHFCCSDRCLFRRNTLLEYGETRIVISTVGLMQDCRNEGVFEPIECNRYYETMVFHAKRTANRYWDADLEREVAFSSPWGISEKDAEDKANDMHEVVVDEIGRRLKSGDIAQEAADGNV